jgi:hypothetical protein
MNKKYNEWTVLSFSRKEKYGSMFLCKCSCGTEKVIFLGNLTSNKSKSCGCKKAENISASKMDHGHSTRGRMTKVYTSWSSMKTRCLNKNSTSYHKYGGRGITVCDRWLDFNNFLKDMGEPQKDYSIERIDNDKGYSKENCKWASSSEQMRNTRRTKLTEDIVKKIRDNELSLKEVISMTGCARSTFYMAKKGDNWK